MNDLISIVLPVYNGERYLRESIDSVMAQTWENWELLIMDDCSDDASPEIAKQYAARDSRIRYYRNEKNLRLPGNLNKGFSLSAGDYLTWTSDENRYRPDALEKMLDTLKRTGKKFVFASCRVIDGDGNEIEYMSVGKNSLKAVVGENQVGACFLYSREVYETIGDYDPMLELTEDFDYWQRTLARFDAAVIEDILYDYRWHDGALTSTMKKERFYHALETTILKNRPAFGQLDPLQKYYYYRGLYRCRAELADGRNPYKRQFELYSAWYMLFVRVPGKLRRMISASSE